MRAHRPGRPRDPSSGQRYGDRRAGAEVGQHLQLLPAVLDEDPGEAAVTGWSTPTLQANSCALVDGLANLLEHATAISTRRACDTGWAEFSAWAGRRHLEPLLADPRTVALNVATHQDRLRRATALLRRLSSIAVAHRTAGHPSPAGHELVRRALVGLRVEHGARSAAKTALVTAPLQVISGRLNELERHAATAAALAGQPGAASAHRQASRYRALLLVGYAAALRRSERDALDVGDLMETDSGLEVFLARSKTDQEGPGEFIGIPHDHPIDSRV